ncbi:MAG TPA: hypothetical protein VMN57_00160 [Anaerolineales bacterium]|nr:hypothetical protein [Anaerolineales bacterium]
MDSNQILEQALNTQRSVASFMLRFTQDLWQDENGDPQVQWRGRINHVQGSEEIPFTDFTEALTFIQRQLQDLTLKAFPSADPEIREKALKESFKLWEQFTADYADLVFATMEKTFKGSQEIQGRVGEALAKSFELWMPPGFRSTAAPAGEPAASAQSTPESPAELRTQLKALNAQVAALSAKLKALEKKQP